ncbi:MAG: ABC transporter permease, partial [Bacteroidales bacterium]|nr:ABC transporter permease [Bacteroidales bacterium]
MNKFIQSLQDIWYVASLEIYRIFHNKSAIMIFFIAGILYPILYSYIYSDDNLTDVPMAVVDNDNSAESKRFVRKLDATPEVQVAYRCANMEEAQNLFESHKVHGVLYIPDDYNNKLASLEQAYISLYCDMSSFLYYRAVYLGTNMVMLDDMRDIELRRYSALGMTDGQAKQMVQPILNESVDLFSPSQGFRSFLLPIFLILILHQTLFFGVTALSGTAYEDGRHYIPTFIRKNSIFRVVIGRSTAYFIIYAGLSVYALMLIPHLFGLPHIANIPTLLGFIVPFILATTFFAMTIGAFFRSREAALVIFPPFTIILLFVTGIAWPWHNIPLFWKAFSLLFPSTFAAQGFVGINTMGASFGQVAPQIAGLWIQAGVYFLLSCMSLR